MEIDEQSKGTQINYEMTQCLEWFVYSIEKLYPRFTNIDLLKFPGVVPKPSRQVPEDGAA